MRPGSRVLRVVVLLLGMLQVGSGITGVAPTLAAGSGQIYVAEHSRDVHNAIVRTNDMTGTGWTSLGAPRAGINHYFTTLDEEVDYASEPIVYMPDEFIFHPPLSRSAQGDQ